MRPMRLLRHSRRAAAPRISRASPRRRSAQRRRYSGSRCSGRGCPPLLADLRVAGVGVALQQADRRYHHAGCAEAALQAVLLPERLLDRMILAVWPGPRPCQPGAIGLHGQHHAALDRLAVQHHRAGAALAGVAADVRAGQVELLAQVLTSSVRGSTSLVCSSPLTVTRIDCFIAVLPHLSWPCLARRWTARHLVRGNRAGALGVGWESAGATLTPWRNSLWRGETRLDWLHRKHATRTTITYRMRQTLRRHTLCLRRRRADDLRDAADVVRSIG